MSVNAADVAAVERADTPAKARTLLARLQRERTGASDKRRAEIDDAIALIREAYSPQELQDPKAGAQKPGKPTAPGKTPGKTGKMPGKTAARAAAGGQQRAKRTGRRFAGRVASQATSPARGLSELAVLTLGASLAFAVIYALITNAERAARGSSALELVAQSTTRGLSLVVAPVDPLTPNASSAAAALQRGAANPSQTTKKGAA